MRRAVITIKGNNAQHRNGVDRLVGLRSIEAPTQPFHPTFCVFGEECFREENVGGFHSRWCYRDTTFLGGNGTAECSLSVCELGNQERDGLPSRRTHRATKDSSHVPVAPSHMPNPCRLDFSPKLQDKI